MLVLIWVLTGHWLLMDGPSATRTHQLAWSAPVLLLTSLPLLHSVGHGLVRGHDSLRAAAQSEGVLPAAVGTAHLRRVLGETRPGMMLIHIRPAVTPSEIITVHFATAEFQQRKKSVNLTKARFEFQNKVRIVVPSEILEPLVPGQRY